MVTFSYTIVFCFACCEMISNNKYYQDSFFFLKNSKLLFEQGIYNIKYERRQGNFSNIYVATFINMGA